MIKREDFSYYSTFLLANEAESRGIQIVSLPETQTHKKNSIVILKYKSHEEVIIAQKISKTDSIGYWLAKQKPLTKYFLDRAGIRVARGQVFSASDLPDIIKFVEKIKFPVVMKPLAGKHGKKVFVDVNSVAKVKKYVKEFKGRILIEKQHEGNEYRVLATREKFLAATNRIPANIKGDGVHTVKELINLKNKDPRRGSGHEKSLVKIKIDDELKRYIKASRKKLSTVLEKDEILYLRQNSNLSTGGDSIDVTSLVHPKIKKLAIDVIKAIPGLSYGGIDLMIKDITKAPTSRNYIIIEVNSSPMISMHHYPYIGKERNVAAGIIDMLFPETKQK